MDNNIGYLKVSNRVNVALSRAKHGMYIFGNANCLLGYKDGMEKQNELWKNVITYMQINEFIGQDLNLYCENHKQTT